jgi:CreA protein
MKSIRIAARLRHALVFCAGTLALGTVHAEQIGSVNTNFRVTGSDKVVVEAYDDPAVSPALHAMSPARAPAA